MTEEQLNRNEIPDSLGKIEFRQITTTWTENDHTTIVVLSGDEIIATANVRFSGDDKKQALLWNLWVLPSFRKAGLAKHIIDFATGIAKGHDCKHLFLDWPAEDTPGWVLDWYKRIGFKIESHNYGSVRLKKRIR